MRKSARVFIPSTAFKYTLPPRPPSPPSGPPKGTNFSRRKLTQPRPPLPACTFSFASSMNFMRARFVKLKRGTGIPCPPSSSAGEPKVLAPAGLFGNYVDVRVPFRALDAKFDNTVGGGKQRVV